MKTLAPLSLALLFACGPQQLPETMQPVGTGAKVLTSETDAGTVVVDPPAPDAGAPLTGFPCEVRAVLQNHCARCHTGETYARELANRDAFLLSSSSEGKNVGQFAKDRMSAGAMYPMPPYGSPDAPTPDEVRLVSDWVSAGMPAGACGALSPP